MMVTSRQSIPASVLQPNPSATISQLVVKTDGTNGQTVAVSVDVAGGGTTGTTTISTRTPTRTSDSRRSNKPIMEKRRRARINNCLNELKALILDATKKDPARHSKLEKADILEMTVKYLKNIQRQQTMPNTNDPSLVSIYRAGFTECAAEVGKYPGMEAASKRQLLQRLAGCLGNIQEAPQLVHVLPSPQRSPEQQVPQSGILLSNGNGGGVQLVPTRLPNGDIALVLPASTTQNQQQAMSSPVPLLVPIVPPERAASSISTTSSSNYNSPSHSPEPMEAVFCNNQQQKPLSLVVRKHDQDDDHEGEAMWRPW